MSDGRERAHDQVSIGDVTAWWRTAITDIEPEEIRFRGYPVGELIGRVGFAEMAWLLLRGELPTSGQARLLETGLVAAVDHGPQAPSIAAARMAATCGVGLNSAVATGVNLLGDVHGGAGQQCMALLYGTARDAEQSARPISEEVAGVLDRHRDAGRLVPGFGHRFHARDPRRDPLLDAVSAFVAEGGSDGRHLAVAIELERQLSTGRSRPVPMNIDGATAVIYCELGFPPELGRGLFVLARSVGILAHAWEEHVGGGRIKGPLPPPLLADYDGEPPRHLLPESPPQSEPRSS